MMMSMSSGDDDWGEGFVSSTFDEMMWTVDVEGNTAMVKLWSTFSVAIAERDAELLLPYVVVPSEVPRLVAAIPQLRAALADRGMTSRPHLVAPEVAYLKLVPNPPQSLVVAAADGAPLPAGTIFATLVRCPDLPDQPGHSVDHWRVFDIGDAVPLADIPPREV
jgi:hypothetical protein